MRFIVNTSKNNQQQSLVTQSRPIIYAPDHTWMSTKLLKALMIRWNFVNRKICGLTAQFRIAQGSAVNKSSQGGQPFLSKYIGR